MARKFCPCGAPVASSRHRYCESCSARAAARRRPSRLEQLGLRPGPVERGYGAKHRRLRAQEAKRVERGEVWCWRCGRWIAPGSKWHLGHDDHDRSVYHGAEHVDCNCATAGRKARQVVRADWG